MGGALHRPRRPPRPRDRDDRPPGSASVSGLLVWWFVLENLLAVFLPADALRLLPFYAGTSLLGIVSDFASPEELAIALTRPENALVFGAYALVALLVGSVLLYRRDVG